jgi:hypothetical protein
VEDKEGESQLLTPMKGLDGQFEPFDEEQDCDVIPFVGLWYLNLWANLLI